MIHFTKKEFEDRKFKVIKELKNKGLKALLMFRQESMYWLTGYDTFGYVFFQCLVLTTKGDLELLTRAPDLRQAQNTSIIKDIRIWVDKDKSNPADELKNILSEHGLEKSNIGVEYESYGLTGRNAMRLNNSLKNFANLSDESELISYLRVIKTPAEIVYVKRAAKLADNAMEAAWKYTKAGVNE
jgi:Xaa-Pro dipeptidase